MIETPKEAAGRLARGAISGRWKAEALHVYSDETGEPIYWRIRARLENGDKWIRPMRLNGHRYELGEPDLPNGKPLYRLHELAVHPGAPCWYVEGENCADALAKLGVLVTTAGGAQDDERTDYRPLARRAVTTWPDNDKAGLAHADRVAIKLRALGCAVETLDARALGLPDKGDCVNWLETHPNAATSDLAKLPRLRVEAAKRKLILEPIGKLLSEPEEATPWLVDGLLPAGGISILAARPKVGKSTLARDLTVRVARGEPFLGRSTAKGAVFILDLEGKRGETASGMRQLGVTNADSIKVFCGTAPQGAFAELREAALAERPALIVIDTMQRLARIPDLNDYAKVSIVFDDYIALARDTGAHVLLLHHQGRSEGDGVDAPMGSTAIAGSVDTILTLKRRKDDNGTRTISSRQRYGSDLEETVVLIDARGRAIAGGLACEHDLRDAGERIIEYLAEHPGAEQSELKDAIEGRWAVVRKALTSLRDTGQLFRAGSGKRGDPFKYSVSSSRGSQEPAEPETQYSHSPIPPAPGDWVGAGEFDSEVF